MKPGPAPEPFDVRADWEVQREKVHAERLRRAREARLRALPSEAVVRRRAEMLWPAYPAADCLERVEREGYLEHAVQTRHRGYIESPRRYLMWRYVRAARGRLNRYFYGGFATAALLLIAMIAFAISTVEPPRDGIGDYTIAAVLGAAMAAVPAFFAVGTGLWLSDASEERARAAGALRWQRLADDHDLYAEWQRYNRADPHHPSTSGGAS
jgi:hypothetical protein